MTYREAVEFGTKCLTDAGVPDAALDAWYLLQMVCRIERSYYYVHGKKILHRMLRKNMRLQYRNELNIFRYNILLENRNLWGFDSK